MKLSQVYSDVQETLTEMGASISAAEAHGLLVGLLCRHDSVEPETWLRAVFAEDESVVPAAVYDVQLTELREQSRTALAQDDFSFEPFLPDDDTDFPERARALGEWCQGFLFGLGYESGDGEWPVECMEVLRDLADISQLDPETSGEGEEEALMEISEFVRMGVQFLRNEFQPRHPQQRLH